MACIPCSIRDQQWSSSETISPCGPVSLLETYLQPSVQVKKICFILELDRDKSSENVLPEVLDSVRGRLESMHAACVRLLQRQVLMGH